MVQNSWSGFIHESPPDAMIWAEPSPTLKVPWQSPCVVSWRSNPICWPLASIRPAIRTVFSACMSVAAVLRMSVADSWLKSEPCPALRPPQPASSTTAPATRPAFRRAEL